MQWGLNFLDNFSDFKFNENFSLSGGIRFSGFFLGNFFILTHSFPVHPFSASWKQGVEKGWLETKGLRGGRRFCWTLLWFCNFFTSSKTSDKCCGTDEKVFYEIETKFTDSNWKLSCAICYMRLLKMEHNTCSISIFTSLKLYFLGFIPSQNI